MNFSIIRLSSENENPKNENTEHRLEPGLLEPIYLRSMQVSCQQPSQHTQKVS